ncbi:helicase-like protein [Purpureocillium lilacinum]|uniref:Helicase-like protein n=1 Tax=Purpureocillium lilacinum TaxID=33203 RepID=A0A179H959_PURLI|nr:helicase-like protein [Purpureocillium lilacinum]OAQ86238.1 helicase-like protein [Purpureocillium lilacinum]OAQ94199.1 helicase-like protein [Purpureocillium lilacinum]GJN67500.1 hypothetical protein PLICBS_001526 [Purpureocillium lilacinum]GJN81408.1 hypothetical protein PLIIFM63780_004942 [Purpureocillium lilacinum]
MAALSEDDIEKLFSGAPQYFARTESHYHGAPHPSVAFPFDEELEIRDLTDHVQIEDRAWSGVTAWPHITRDQEHDAAARRQAEEKHRAHFYVRCRERPNMLSMHGVEKGTMGYQAALELSAADSLEEEQFGFESVGTKARAIVDARERILGPQGWLHRLPEHELLDRLRRNADLYRRNDLRSRKSADTYADLFHAFMRPCNTVIDRTDRHSLSNQIVALLKCMGTANVWIDLSRVEWRIRLGQVLWGEKGDDDLDDATAVHDADSAAERAEEKYWLFMQILVASELLLRLDAVTDGVEFGSGGIKPIDVAYFERGATQTVKWSLMLARSWLENVEIIKEEEKEPGLLRPPPPPMPRRGSSWLASLVSRVSNRYHRHAPAMPCRYTIQGRHSQRQVDGLIHFARNLMWPGIDRYEYTISERAQIAGGATPTKHPSSSTTSVDSEKPSSYFGAWDVTCHRGKRKGRAQAQRRKLAAALHESGWITKSYVFGLVLPGETLCHYLMATLLENDREAMAKLGPCANLSGGFVYSGKSFWSTSCIVGRVLAAGKGAAECMGWISTDVVPEGRSDGWLSIEAEDVADDLAHLGKKARIWGKKRLERESSILGDGKEDSVSPADFIVPHETGYSASPPSVYVELLALELSAPAGAVPATPLAELIPTPSTTTDAGKAPEIISYPASIRFSVSVEGRDDEEVTYPLTYDISFVTAHPCAPSHRVRMLKSPSSPTIQKIDVSGSAMLQGSRSVNKMGHPLHKYYNFTVIHISELLQKPRTTLSEFLLDPTLGKAGGATNGVLVVDCITNLADAPQSPALERVASSPSGSPVGHRKGSFSAAAQMFLESRKRQFGSDMEVLVRALCAQRGWNALVSRRKRGCLACAIREAGALGWKVIVRVE